MAMDKEGQQEYTKHAYPKKIVRKDGTVQTVNSFEEEANAHREDNED